MSESISTQIYEEISAGAYTSGQKLPSERDLERKYQVSRVTVNRALTALHARGVVERRKGSGTFVRDIGQHLLAKSNSKVIVKYITPGGKVHGDLYVTSGHQGMCKELNSHDKDVVSRFYYSEEDYLDELNSLLDRSFAAAIIWRCVSEKGDRILQELIRKNICFVLLDSYSKGLDCDYVVTDNVHGSQQMVRHLVACGHQNIVYVGKSPSGCTSLDDRQVGFIHEMLACGLPVTTDSVVRMGDGGIEDALEGVVDMVLGRPACPTAIYASNDIYAFGLYEAFKKRGVSVPGDISLAGFDDIDRSEHFEVPLTTVSQDFYEMGRTAASIIHRRSQEALEQDFFYQVSIKPSLRVRDSVADLI